MFLMLRILIFSIKAVFRYPKIAMLVVGVIMLYGGIEGVMDNANNLPHITKTNNQLESSNLKNQSSIVQDDGSRPPSLLLCVVTLLAGVFVTALAVVLLIGFKRPTMGKVVPQWNNGSYEGGPLIQGIGGDPEINRPPDD